MTNGWNALSLALALSGVSLGLLACGGETDAGGGTPTENTAPPPPAEPAAPEAAPEAPPAEARASWDEPSFTLNASTPGPYNPNVAGTFELRLDARGGFHVNREYPWTVAVTAPDGVTTPSATIESAAMTFSEGSATIPVFFTASSAGTHRITCAVDFGICTEEHCQMEVRNVAVDVVVAEAAPVAPAAPTGAPTEG